MAVLIPSEFKILKIIQDQIEGSYLGVSLLLPDNNKILILNVYGSPSSERNKKLNFIEKVENSFPIIFSRFRSVKISDKS